MVTTYIDHLPPSQGIDPDRRSAERENRGGVGALCVRFAGVQDDECWVLQRVWIEQSPHPRSSLTRRGREAKKSCRGQGV